MNKKHPIYLIKGFLLTRSWRDTADGITLSFWLTTEKGIAHVQIEKQNAICFVNRENQIKFTGKAQRKPLSPSLIHPSRNSLIFPQENK